MGCGCGGGGGNVAPVVNRSMQQTFNVAPITPSTFNLDENGICSITSEMLQKWKAVLECVNSRGRLGEANLSTVSYNQILGVIQSALNYPDNYCYYKPQLLFFQNTILPKIVQYVQECIQ